jgi:hypothetical protein
MFSISLASEIHFEELRQFRARVFQAELGIQDGRYQDVFNDYFSKNILLRAGSKLVGAVRLAFSRETQNFYISYLAVEAYERNHSHVRLLLAAILYIMRRNGIHLVYGDATDENLPMYLSVGCRPVSQKFSKYGFNCEWTRIEYTLGANRFEDHLVEKVKPYLQHEDLAWRYSPRIVVCSDMDEYRECLRELIHTKEIYGLIPHYDPSSYRTPEVVRCGLVGPAQVIRASNRSIPVLKNHYQEGFEFYNERFENRNVILVGQNSPLLELAKTYGVLSGKRVVTVGHWEDFSIESEPPPDTLLLFLEDNEISKVVNSLKQMLNKVKWGIASGDSIEAISSLALKNYIQFLSPIRGRDVIVSQERGTADECTSGETDHPFDFPQEEGDPPLRMLVKEPARQSVVSSESQSDLPDCNGQSAKLICILTKEDLLPSLQKERSNRRSSLNASASHLVIGRCNEGSEQEEGLLFLCLMRQGSSVGEAVWILNRAFASHRAPDDHYLLFGDPSLRFLPKRRMEQSFSCMNQPWGVEVALRHSGEKSLAVFSVQMPASELVEVLLDQGVRFESDDPDVRCAHYVEGDTVHLFAFGLGPLPQALRLTLQYKDRVGRGVL